MRFNYYDIESLRNVFTLVNYDSTANHVDVYALLDEDLHRIFLANDDPAARQANWNALTTRIHEKNRNFTGTIGFCDLASKQGMGELASLMGLSSAGAAVNDKNAPSVYAREFRPVCDTDKGYDEDEHPYLLGYNSYNYDLTMLAYLFYTSYTVPKYGNGRNGNATVDVHGNAFSGNVAPVSPTAARETFVVPTPQDLRDFNDKLFSDANRSFMPNALRNMPGNDRLAWNIRKSMLMSGRHLDVARLNEKQSRVGLKRLLGMLGYQILESDKLSPGCDHIADLDELFDLIAYNVSDCVNLEKLFLHPFYQGQFSLKRGLLKTYPELIYKRKADAYAPDVRPDRVKPNRMTIDAPSAQLATQALCPYDHLKDLPTVSYLYPATEIVEERRARGENIEQRDILEETMVFVEERFADAPHVVDFFRENVYGYYKDIEGKNFNDSDNYADDMAKAAEAAGDGFDRDEATGDIMLPDDYMVNVLGSIPKRPNCMPYYDVDGNPTSCYVTFSTGGIHGAEYNKALYDADMAAYHAAKEDLDYVRGVYPDPLDLRRAKDVEMPDGRVERYTRFLTAKATIKAMDAMPDADSRAEFWREPATPQLFKAKDNGSTELNKRYAYTSADPANHEDFTSYYPNLLRQMRAFWNPGLGIDRYGEIFDNKQRYGKLMKDPSLTQEERDLYAVQREGTKLILNSASGAADTNGRDSAIQMNNRIISMRIIGQLFTWRIGQAQTLEGAKITSTNTDGLYSVMEKGLNDAILARESADIGVEIEPEPMFLVSKDANNRMELSSDLSHVFGCGGASLACYRDTNPTKALAHPAIIDWALSRYLTYVAAHGDMHDGFNALLAYSIFNEAKYVFEPTHALRMFQNVLASSPGSINYIFSMTDEQRAVSADDDAAYRTAYTQMQHYNRVFIVRDKTPGSVHLMAANAKAITPAMFKKRHHDGDAEHQDDPKALAILKAQNVNINSVHANRKECVVKRIPNLDPDWYMLVDNSDINAKSDAEAKRLLGVLDIDKYVGLLKDAYEANWQNA